MIILPRQSTDSTISPLLFHIFFLALKESSSTSYEKTKELKIVKTALNKKITSKGISIWDLKPCYRTIVIKFIWFWNKNKELDQKNWVEDSYINSQHLCAPGFQQKGENYTMEKMKASSTKSSYWILAFCRRRQVYTYLSICTKLNSNCIKDLNIKSDTVIWIEGIMGDNLEYTGIGDNFLERTPTE